MSWSRWTGIFAHQGRPSIWTSRGARLRPSPHRTQIRRIELHQQPSRSLPRPSTSGRPIRGPQRLPGVQESAKLNTGKAVRFLDPVAVCKPCVRSPDGAVSHGHCRSPGVRCGPTRSIAGVRKPCGCWPQSVTQRPRPGVRRTGHCGSVRCAAGTAATCPLFGRLVSTPDPPQPAGVRCPDRLEAVAQRRREQVISGLAGLGSVAVAAPGGRTALAMLAACLPGSRLRWSPGWPLVAWSGAATT